MSLESQEEKEERLRAVGDSSYTDFTDWSKVEKPRSAALHSFGNQVLSAMAISGDDYLRFQSKLNPAMPFNNPLKLKYTQDV